jgi:hypothetical protein
MRTNASSEEDFSPEIVPEVVPKAPWRVAEVRAMAGYRLWVRFSDGLQGTVAMSGLVHSPSAGVFATLQDEGIFLQVTLDYGAVCWPGEIDLAPDAMYEAIRRDGEWVLS